jgi:hypothetical protein
LEIDSDEDGIVNNKDECPDTPADAVVDYNGCPSTPYVEDEGCILSRTINSIGFAHCFVSTLFCD